MPSSDLQFYRTPEWVTKELFAFIGRKRLVCDPCAGDGAILRAADAADAFGYEIDPDRARKAGNRVRCANGLDSAWYGHVIMNPPFKGESWWPWAERLERHGYGWMLLPLTVLSAASHRERLHRWSMLILSRRIPFTGTTPSYSHAWFSPDGEGLWHA